MKRLKLFFACLLMAILSIGQVWGEDPAAAGTTLFSENFSGYAKDAVPSGEVTTATGRVVYGGANVTYSVTNGSGTTKIYEENTAEGTSPEILVGKSNGTLTIDGIPSGGAKAITVSYKQNKQKLKVESTTTGYSGSKDEKPSSVGANSVDITIADGSAETFTLVFTCTGSSNVRVDDILVTVKTAGESASPSCTSEITITKADDPANGSFALDNSGTVCIDEGNATVNVTATPAAHYHLASVSSTVGTVGTISNNTCAITNISANTTISATFAEDDKVKVTWNVNGDETLKTDVYVGEKPVFPATPESCDATSTTFIGWATATWTGKAENLNGKTVYTSASAMPDVNAAVTYYAVFAKISGASGWVAADLASLTASDVFVITGTSTNVYALSNDKGTDSAPSAVEVTIADGKISGTVADNIKWNISGNATDGYTFYPNGDSEKWLYATNTNNGVRVGTNDSKTFKIQDNYLYHVGTTRYVGIYNKSDWRCYTSINSNITGQSFAFYKYTAGSASDYMTTCTEPECEKKVNISAGETEHGTFELDKTGNQYTCDDAVEVIVTPSPAEHYHVATVIATTGEEGVDNGDGTWTITYAQETNTSSTINVTFVEDTKYQVTWNVNGNEDTKTQVYAGEKPAFPATPQSCDETSTAFIGWATEAWSGKLAAPAVTVYTSADDMPDVDAAVTYYAVFAKSSGAAAKLFEWKGGTKAELEAAEGVAALEADNSDYAEANAPYRVKWNGTGKYIIISVASQPGIVSAGFKMIGGATTSTITVQEADDAEGPFTDVENLAISGSTNDEVDIESTQAFKSTTRAIKLYYTKGSNVGLGPISIEGTVSMSDYMTTCCTKYDITIDSEIENGTVSADLAQACEGATVTMTFTPAGGYHLESWSVNDDEQDVSATTFAMPAEDVEVSAVFAHDDCANLAAPTLDKITKSYNSATIAWNAVVKTTQNADVAENGVVGYLVTVTKEGAETPIFSGNVTDLSKALTDLEPETKYYYSVMAIGEGADYCADGNEVLEGNFTTDALPEVQLWLVKKQGEDAVDGGKHTLGVEFDLTPSDVSCAKTFVGWTTVDYKDYTSETTAPAVLINKYTFNSTDAVTLYAVYADVEGEEATTYPVDFEANADTYTNWTLTNMTSQGTNSNVTAHGGSYFGTTGGKETASLVTKAKIAKPSSITFYVSKQTTNTSASSWIVEVSTDGSAWTQVGDAQDAKSMTRGDWVEVTRDLSAHTNAYVRVSYSGSTAVRCIDDLVLSTASTIEHSNYATTCGAAPVAVVDPEEINATAAAVAAGVIEAAYENVNESAISVALFNDQACTEAFEGVWLTATLNNDKNIAYTIAENTSYYDARSAYIKLTAPETNGATAPAVIVIPVTQAKKAAEFASLEDLVAANLTTNTNVTVSFENVVIKDFYEYNSKVSGVVFNIQKDNADIKIYFNNQTTITDWVAGGKLSGTLTNCPWKTYSNAWQLAPASGWAWENLIYTEPAAVKTVEITGGEPQKTYVDGEKFNPAGLNVLVTYTDNNTEVNPSGVTFSEATLAENQTSVQITAMYNNVTSDPYTVNGLTVDPIQVKDIADFISDEGGRCYLVGIVSNYTNKTKGYFDMTDASGTLHIYGCTSPSEFEEGDKIKVLAEVYELYGTTPEAKNVEYVETLPQAVKSVSLDITEKTVEVAATFTLTATVLPAKATTKTVTWSTSDEAVATVESGVVTGVAPGTATITVTTTDGGLTASCAVTVIAAPEHYTLTLMASGSVYQSIDAVENSSIWTLLGSVTDPDIAGYNFKGWSATEAGDVLTEGTAGTMTADKTLYAVYAKGNVTYVKVTETGAITSGQYLIVYEGDNNHASVAFNGALEILDDASNTIPVTINNGVINGNNSTNAAEFTIGSTGTIRSKSGFYIGRTANSNGMNVDATDEYTHTFSIDGSSNAVITSSGNPTLRYNYASDQARFRYYKSGQQDIALYKRTDGPEGEPVSTPTITVEENEVVNISNVVDEEVPVTIVVENGGTMNIDQQTVATSITAKDGATININEETVASNVVVEDGGKINANAETTTPIIYFSTTMGSTQTPGSGTELGSVTNITLATGGEIIYDLTLGTSMAGVQADPNQWHAFTLPFAVDALNGIYDAETGDKLENEENYAIMVYDGAVRANGQYGWKKYRGILQPGVFYLMTVDGNTKTFRFKAAKTGAMTQTTSMSVTAFNGSSTDDSDKGWNGIGNPRWISGTIAKAVYVLDPYSYEYVLRNASAFNFYVSTPFFYFDNAMTGITSVVSMEEANASSNYAPRRTPAKEIKDVEISFGNEVYKDLFYISASEDALNKFEQDQDQYKMRMSNTPKVAQIMGNAYGKKMAKIYAPMSNDKAEYSLTLYAPAAGEYTISAPEMENAEVYLTYNGSIVWNLSMSEYTSDFEKGNNEGYGLLLVKKVVGVATGVENAETLEATGVQKVVIDDKVFILRAGQMYDVTGKMVK